MELSGMSLKELRDLNQECEAQLRKRGKKDREQAVEQIYSIAHSLGMTLSNLLNGAKIARKPSATPSKQYRDPANPDNRWVGKGPRPKWLKQALTDGKSLESFLAD